MPKIEDLLQRRTDLSTFLIHLTRDSPDDGPTARENLLAMIGDGYIEARKPFGPAAAHQRNLTTVATQKVVCFTETPLEHTWMMLQDIETRQVHFQPYGLAITKTTARKAGCNPVWYSDITPGNDWPIAAVNAMVQDAVLRSTDGGKVDRDQLSAEPIFKITPFFEQMGPMNNGGRKEFWWEREWRHTGDIALRYPRTVAVFAPADDHDQLRAELTDIHPKWGQRPILDPRWGLERMIVSLANISDEHVGPFPDAI